MPVNSAMVRTVWGGVFADGVVEIHAGGGSEGGAVVGVLIVAGAEGGAKC